MPDDPRPTLADALGAGIKLNITGSLPGEALMTAIMQYVTTVRANMDPALLRRWDAITIQQMEDLQSLWRGIWETIGVLPKEQK